MKISLGVRVTILACCAVALVPPAMAQTASRPATTTQTAPAAPTETESRGVRILRPDVAAQVETRPPAPSPAPVPGQLAAPVGPPAPLAVAPPVIKPCARPVASPDISLPVKNFDKELARRLKSGRRVVVDLDQPFPQKDAPPAPFDRWLSEVRASGGEVAVEQYCDVGRGMLSGWLAKLFGGGDPGALYRPARSYDAVLHADALDRVVTQIEFTPKSARAKP